MLARETEKTIVYKNIEHGGIKTKLGVCVYAGKGRNRIHWLEGNLWRILCERLRRSSQNEGTYIGLR
jgi:hypothetical protein